MVFRDFIENSSNDLAKTLPNGRGNRYEAFAKKSRSRASSVLDIFIHKVQIFAENGKSGVQRSLYISRTVNGTENLIRYSESTENFLSCTSHQIFAYLSSSGRKFGPKIGNFDLILDDPFDQILPISARMTLKLSGNDVSDDLNRLRMPTCDFGSFKKHF